ncbi:diacylglycerol kinase [Pseudoalteromonas carrageenovora]|uniref:diacylglycerol kinase n=1 Tax=Pseudoalteromonas carrageenovora TaxID=227 RepID=UPI0026E30395|nr:diacylglycerol kinase [Pseudoalteromonas carrageenovora]MDO6549391.1 diacylglycerol kinase [Pseudoalteromonas carrageenovora]MDO6833965.1 diacylglycerol kinase [Pseudoalteromonas carrageenovora]MDO6837797.1 diacylglycerol kinase [Pseudoalteromonas carrageenovora]
MKDVFKPNGLGIKRIFKATYCSYLGFKAAFIEEAAFRQELLLSIILLPISFWLASSVLHWALLISTLLIILIVELLNSAIEALTDRVSTERHVLSGRAKDMGSAAVTLSLMILMIVWGASFYIKLFQ